MNDDNTDERLQIRPFVYLFRDFLMFLIKLEDLFRFQLRGKNSLFRIRSKDIIEIAQKENIKDNMTRLLFNL